MRVAYGGTCEACISIDVRRWHREGRLRAGQSFSCAWTGGGEPLGSISVRTECDGTECDGMECHAVILFYRARRWGAHKWKPIEQRVPITWTACHLGGQRPWFVRMARSNCGYRGRRAALPYATDELFACRRCCGLAYASQQEAPMYRGVGLAREC